MWQYEVINLPNNHKIMTYQDYFKQTNFEDIWAILSGFYGEHDALKLEYEALVTEIKKLPILPEHSSSTIKMQLDPNNEIMVVGAPDPQEWLLGREVETDFSYWRDYYESDDCDIRDVPFNKLTSKEKCLVARRSDTATLAAHLLYWSTLYAIKTSQQHAEEFTKWVEDSFKDIPHKYKIEQEYEAESRYKKHQKYWRNAVSCDSAIDWSGNLRILSHKLQYNIGNWRYVQRHVGWEEDVKRMQLCCSLLKIAANDYLHMEGVYVNERNAARYKIEVKHDEFLEVYLGELRREKAFRIVWRFIDHNMKGWWD